ncbi:hypothetical protein D3C73_1044720 [compost metagenome]
MLLVPIVTFILLVPLTPEPVIFDNRTVPQSVVVPLVSVGAADEEVFAAVAKEFTVISKMPLAVDEAFAVTALVFPVTVAFWAFSDAVLLSVSNLS